MPALYRNSFDRAFGFWGEPTSTLDWCEENYVVTKYVAEFCKFFPSIFRFSLIRFAEGMYLMLLTFET